MGRRLRANSGKPTQRKNGPVSTYMRRPNKGYTLPEAAFLMWQGYSDEHVESTTGFDPKVVHNHLEKEGVPTLWMTTK